MAGRKESPNNLTIGLSTWADHVEVTENSKHNGIELLFNREPFPLLQSKLRAIGFRPSKVKNMWYSENNQTAKAFALDVQSSITTSSTGPDLILTPSFESKRITIEKKEFSFILITLKDNHIKNYIVFEPSKPKAEVIATKFAREHFGDNFSGLAVKPRTQIREARILFDEGKIIFPRGQQTIEEKPTKKPLPVSSEVFNTQSSEPLPDKDVVPISDYPMLPILLPEEEETIEQYLEKGFKIPFSAPEAFDKNLPVIDLAFRSAPAMDYFNTHIEIPLQKQIQELQKELKGLNTSEQRDRKTTIKNEIENLEFEIRVSEKLIESESLIFQEGMFRIILEKANQKGYYKLVKSNLSDFRDYMLTNLLNNRAIENYSKDGVQKVINELLEEYIGSEAGNDTLNIEPVSPTAKPISSSVEKQVTSKTKKHSQHDRNKEIEKLIDRKDYDKEFFSEEEKNQIRQYSGSGGLINQGATGKGVLYEYYTTDTIIKKMWDIAYHYGYDGGAVLEPSVGTGNFLKYGPKGSAIVGYEINHYAARIAQILYPAAQIHEAAFETLFFAGNIHLKDDFGDTRYSLVIGNPPYGEFSGRYAGMGEKKWTGASQYEHYFTLRGLDLLKSGGLLIYIVPSNFLRGSSFSAIAEKIAAKCIGLDRYCLGTGIFKTTDIETDIIALRKN